jgi:hypothetical protein
VSLGVGVIVGVFVSVGVRVIVGVGVIVRVGVAVRVAVEVNVAVAVRVLVAGGVSESTATCVSAIAELTASADGAHAVSSVAIRMMNDAIRLVSILPRFCGA